MDSATVDHYKAEVLSQQDYYPFGMLEPGRNIRTIPYPYAFNGKRIENVELSITNIYDYGMRSYDARIGRFYSVDPLTSRFPWLTPYQFSSNSPIANSDLDGMESSPAGKVYSDAPSPDPKYVGGAIVKPTVDYDVVTKVVIGFGKALLNGFGALTEILGQMHYGDKISPQNRAKTFPLTYNQDFRSLAANIAYAPLISAVNISKNPKDPEAYGSALAVTLSYFSILKGFNSKGLAGTEEISIDDIFTNSISTRGLAEKYALQTTYKGFENANEIIKTNNPVFDLINAEGDIVDITTTTAKKLNPSQFYKKLSNLADLKGFNSRTLQIYIKKGQYSTEELNTLSKKLNTFINNNSNEPGFNQTNFRIDQLK